MTNPEPYAESVADPPPVPLVADPALIIDRAHYNDLLRVRFWHWLKRHNDGTASARTLTEKDVRDCFERENGYPLSGGEAGQ